MESLSISNFLTIKQASLDVRRFTLLIGPQANGKSVVAKVLYFFQNFLATYFIRSVSAQATKRDLERQGISAFEQIFPRYAWVDQDFKLVYRSNDIELSIIRNAGSSSKTSLKFNLSKNLIDVHKKAKHHYRRRIEEHKAQEEQKGQRDIRDPRVYEISAEVLRECIYEAPIGANFQWSVFIPASRSFFANLQKNVFSFLANNIAIDPLIKGFGSIYESSKLSYERRPLRRTENNDSSAIYDAIKEEIERILAGRYVYEEDQDWIISGRRRINLVNASSGQQEALPLLIVLLTRISRFSRARPTTFFIEEPEAHLFPVSQRRLVSIFARLYNAFNYNFILTTHSPYVLTALNNHIMASNLVEEKGENVIDQVEKIIGNDSLVKFEDVSAYTIQNGVLESILDNDTHLIGSSIIDSVSDEFDQLFGKLMEIELS